MGGLTKVQQNRTGTHQGQEGRKPLNAQPERFWWLGQVLLALVVSAGVSAQNNGSHLKRYK